MNRARTVAAALAAPLALIAACGTKHVTAPQTPDAKYASALRSEAVGTLIVTAQDADIATLGHGVCNLLDRGYQPPDIAGSMVAGHTQSEYSTADAAASISLAVKIFCPKHQDLVQAWNGAPTPTTSTSTTMSPTTIIVKRGLPKLPVPTTLTPVTTG